MLGIICQDEWQEKYAKEPGELGELKNGLRSEDSLENWRDIRTEGKRKETWKLKRSIRIEGHHEKGLKILDYIAKYAVRRYSMCFKTMWLSEEKAEGVACGEHENWANVYSISLVLQELGRIA